MPRKSFHTRLSSVLLVVLGGWALGALLRAPAARRPHTRQLPDSSAASGEREEGVHAMRRSRPRRLTAAVAFTALFFAGAALSAGAGDVVVGVVESDTSADSTGSTEESATEPVTTEESGTEAEEPAPTESEPEPTETEPPAGEGSGDGDTGGDTGGGGGGGEGGEGESPAEPDPDAPSAPESPSGGAGGSSPPGNDAGSPAPAAPVYSSRAPRNAKPSPPELEGDPAYATIWLHRALPDPTPPSRRLSPAFARMLREVARDARVDWALVLAVLRARGRDGSVPAGRAALVRMAAELADMHGFSDRVVALRRYNRAVGLRALVVGLEAAKPALMRKVLADERIDVYAGGRGDIASGRVDVRVLVLLRYLAVAEGQVTVSSLRAGHRFFSRPGVVSAHVYGLAVDIAALGGKPIAGHQQPGGLTERAVREILLLPRELQPQQVISLLGIGGPSFPMADHDDHIHVGYA